MAEADAGVGVDVVVDGAVGLLELEAVGEEDVGAEVLDVEGVVVGVVDVDVVAEGEGPRAATGDGA